LPQPGETVLGGEFSEFFGGKGANQAVAAHRAGGGRESVAFLGKIGTDDRGNRYADYLKSEGLDTSALGREEETPTGVALIVVDPAGENLIAVAPGANARLSAEDVTTSQEVIHGARVLLAQLEVPEQTVETAFRLGAGSGAKTLLNPAPAPPGGVPKDLLSMTDVLIPNRVEAEALTGVQIDSTKAAEAACAALHTAGVKTVVITLGEEGVVFSGPKGSGHVPRFPVEAVDATGAGDAFCGALAAALGEGRDLLQAVRFAAAAGALACTVPGAQPSLPFRERIDALLAGNG
jgi:ribokinase